MNKVVPGIKSRTARTEQKSRTVFIPEVSAHVLKWRGAAGMEISYTDVLEKYELDSYFVSTRPDFLH